MALQKKVVWGLSLALALLPGKAVWAQHATLGDESTLSLRVARAWGRYAAAIEHLRIPLGKRLTGLVAAGCNAVHDADPSIDFMGDDNFDSGCFRRCTALPVAIDYRVLGVLTIYLSSPCKSRGFEDQDLTFACAHVSNYFSSIRPPEH